MTVKDAFETEGLVTTSGAPGLRDHVPDRDADAVARLKGAGAVVFGKTNLPIYAGDLQTYNEVYGVTSNPWALDRTPGGSSGGAAAAVAAGLTGFEVGSDIGGSIRNPAHFCGVFGHKASYGIIPRAGPHPRAAREPLDAGRRRVRALRPQRRRPRPRPRRAGRARRARRVGVAPRPAAGPQRRRAAGPAGGDLVRRRRVPVAADVYACLVAAAAALADGGATVVDAAPAVALADLGRSWEDLVLPIMSAGLPQEAFDGFATIDQVPEAPGEDVATRSLRSITMRHRRWLSCDERRQHHRAAFAEFFRHHDVLLAPVMPTAAFPHDTESDLPFRTIEVDGVTRPYMDGLVWNGGIGTVLVPVSVPPVGRTPDGLPVGVQVVAPFLEDRTAIAVAGHIERLLGGFTPPPAFA